MVAETTAAVAESARRRDVIAGMGYANGLFYFMSSPTRPRWGSATSRSPPPPRPPRGPHRGDFDSVFFALGLIGAGLIAVPVLPGSAAYPLAELFN